MCWNPVRRISNFEILHLKSSFEDKKVTFETWELESCLWDE